MPDIAMSASRQNSEGRGKKRNVKDLRSSIKKMNASEEVVETIDTTETRKPRTAIDSVETPKSGKSDTPDTRRSKGKLVDTTESRKSAIKSSDTPVLRKSGKSAVSSELSKVTGKYGSRKTVRKLSNKRNSGGSSDIKKLAKAGNVSEELSEESVSENESSTFSSYLTKPKREVEQIFGITDQRGVLEFSIKFKKEDTVELIPLKVANVEFPQEVIQFYQERLVWKPNSVKATN